MRLLLRWPSLGLLLAVSPVHGQAPAPEPFGFHFGVPEQALTKTFSGITKTEKPHVYLTATPPRPHPKFETYLLMAGPKQGLCKVVAIGPGIERDSYGTAVRNAFEELRATLTAKYGEPQVTDELNTGSIWNEPREWLMAVYQHERTLQAIWSGSSPTLGGASILLKVNATSASDGYVSLGYEGPEIDACLAEIKSAPSDAL